jgi:hypothetical protein
MTIFWAPAMYQGPPRHEGCRDRENRHGIYMWRQSEGTGPPFSICTTSSWTFLVSSPWFMFLVCRESARCLWVVLSLSDQSSSLQQSSPRLSDASEMDGDCLPRKICQVHPMAWLPELWCLLLSPACILCPCSQDSRTTRTRAHDPGVQISGYVLSHKELTAFKFKRTGSGH